MDDPLADQIGARFHARQLVSQFAQPEPKRIDYTALASIRLGFLPLRTLLSGEPSALLPAGTLSFDKRLTLLCPFMWNSSISSRMNM